VNDSAERAALVRVRADVLDRIATAAARAGRDPAAVRLVAVTKTVPAERVQAAVAAGLTVLGENRVQEAAEKRPGVQGATWHLVGPLQSNKVRRAIETFDVIQTVDSIDLGRRIARIAAEAGRAPFPVLLQVNVDRDPDKAGFTPEGVDAALRELLGIEGLRLDGLMTVGRLVERAAAARPTFAALRDLRDRLRATHPGLGSELSMGMTDDFEVAIEEGATIVRVGRALFGERA
jgi:PLP dependent protein